MIAKKFKNKRQIYLMLLPNVLIFSAMSIYPILWVLKYMFFQYDMTSPAKFIGLDNFVRAFTRDTYFWRTVLNTLVYVVGKLVLTLPFSFLLALLLNKKFRGNRAVQAMIFSPTIMSASVMAIIFYFLFNAYNGDVNHYLMKLGIIHSPVNWLGQDYAMLTVIIVGAWGALGNYMVYFLAGLQSIPNDIYESAEIDGVTPWRKLWSITIPMLGPVLKIILMLAITIAFQDMQSIMVLTEGGPNGATEVMFLYVYKFFFPLSAGGLVRAEFGYGAALSVISAVIVGGITMIYLFFTRKLDEIY
ncbi:sugar ABC transporter permease [Paenibacillus thalictri]|uniref:Sugar ABC transporter permease n=2 Tax=Paenibacillus thalictri TaxID=2527873 RepID=A0A4Q9DXS9_9BACL|nr:sugar ABC transporter permease [Paenibacillus thalictri]